MGKANKNNITKHQDVNRKLTSKEVDLNFQELINNIEDTQAIEINFNEQAEAIQQVRTELQAADSEYGIGVKVTRRNQTVWKDGIPYRPNATLELPYTTTGDWSTEGDLFVSVGDAVLRQDLANPNMGAAIVARGVVVVDSIADLTAMPEGQRREDLRYLVRGYHSGSDVGGGIFYWNGADLSEECTKDPLKGIYVAPSGQTGTNGAWVRSLDGEPGININWFGAVGDGIQDDRPSIQEAIDFAIRSDVLDVIIPPAQSLYAIKSTNPDHPSIGLVLSRMGKNVYDGRSARIKGSGARSTLRLMTGRSDIHALLCMIDRNNHFEADGVTLDANGEADYALEGGEYSGEYNPYIYCRSCIFRNAKISPYRVASYVARLDLCIAQEGKYGFHFARIGGGPATSHTITSCYALNNTDAGFFGDYMTYSAFIGCAVDGNATYDPKRAEYAYRIDSAYSVSFTGCGSERNKRLLYVGVFRGLTVNSMFGLNQGSLIETVDTDVYLGRGTGCTLAGIRTESRTPHGSNKILTLGSVVEGQEAVTILDNCVTRSQAVWPSGGSYNFDRPIKFIRDDESTKDRTIQVSTVEELRTAFRNYITHKTQNHTLIIQLSSGVYEIGSMGVIGAAGGGRVIIRGNPSAPEDTVFDVNNYSFSVENSSCLVQLEGITVTSNIVNNSAIRVVCRSGRLYLNNVRILRNGRNTGAAVYCSLNGVVTIGEDVEAEAGHYALGGAFLANTGGKIEYLPRESAPESGAWTQGSVIPVKNPISAGFMYWVRDGSTWVPFGPAV